MTTALRAAMTLALNKPEGQNTRGSVVSRQGKDASTQICADRKPRLNPITNPEGCKVYRKITLTKTLRFLQTEYPKCFVSDPRKARPLMVGIYQVLIQRHNGLLKPWALQEIIKGVVTGRQYLLAVVKGRPRIDLTGKGVAEVSEKERAHAQKALVTLNSEKDQRRIEKKSRAKKPGPKITIRRKKPIPQLGPARRKQVNE